MKPQKPLRVRRLLPKVWIYLNERDFVVRYKGPLGHLRGLKALAFHDHQHAARLFTRPVRVLVTYTIAGDNASEGRIEELDSWQSVDEFREEPLVAFDAVRALARDEKIRASDWLDELFDEED